MKLLKPFSRVPFVVWVILALMFTFSRFSEHYLTVHNMINVMQQGAVLLVVAAAMTIVILSEGLDLSLGAVMTMSGIVSVLALKAGMSIGMAVTLGILSGTLMGMVTGTLVAIAKMPPFIATLGMQGVIYGFTLAFTNSAAIFSENETFNLIGGKIGDNIPVAAILAFVIFLLVWATLHYTRFGRYVIAIGGNEAGAHLSGINTTFWKWFIYVFAGTVTAMGGVILAARMEAADPIVGFGWEFDAIAATILGGTSFQRGRGDVGGTIIGVVLLTVIRNGMNVVSIPNIWQPALMGTIIILAIVFQVWLTKRDWATK